ncbi:MAG: alpha/beta hydrolase [Synergistaceae bacterium]|nr:alpha/beta hydrolase [Synergistaceae bacterium]
MSVNIESINAASHDTKFFRFGSDSKTLVIIPGLSVKSVMDFADSVAEAYKIFADEFTVYVFDRVSNPNENYTIYDMADDTIKAFDSLKIKDAYIISVSQGAMIAQVLAARRPDLVKKLVLGSSASRIPENSAKIFSEWTRLARKRNVEALNTSFAAHIYSEKFFAQYREAILSSMSNVTDSELERFIILAASMRGMNLSSELENIKCPVLVIADSNDKIFDVSESKTMAEKLNCGIFIYHGYGHAVYDEAPDYKARILKFFRE